MPTLTEHLLALGEWEAAFEWDPDLAALLSHFKYVSWWWGQRRIYTGPILTTGGDRYQGLIRKGRSVEWVLGLDNTIPGPVIEDRRYFSGRSKLSNGDFELGESDWKIAEDSGWTIDGTSARQGAYGAGIDTSVDADDILQANDVFPDVRPGDELRLSGYARRPAGTVGRLRPRVVFEGRFNSANLLTNGGFEDGLDDWYGADGFTAVTDAGEARAGSGVLRIDERPPIEQLTNGGFETGDFTFWSDFGIAPGWSVQSGTKFDGTYAMHIDIAGALGAGYELGSTELVVIPGAEYRFRFRALTTGNPDSQVFWELDFRTDGGLTNERSTIAGVWQDGSDWQLIESRFTVPEDRDRLELLLVQTAGGTTGHVYIDNVELVLLHGHTGDIAHSAFVITPERTYRARAELRTGPAAVEGSVKAYAVLSAPDREDLQFESAVAELTLDTWRVIEFEFTPPSGYDVVVLHFQSLDLRGDYGWLDQVELRDVDTSTRVTDGLLGPVLADWTAFTVDATAPAGTDTARVELVAESPADGWQVDDVDFRFINVTVPTVAEVARELLIHPDTGFDLLYAGDISGDETLGYDWSIRNLPLRSAIRHLAQGGLASPIKEWVTDPDGTFRFGTADELFVDRTQMIITAEDAHVVPPPQGLDATATVEDTGEVVRLIGATRPAVQQRRFKTYDGLAENPSMGSDFLGNPLARVLVVEDSTVDHAGFAAAQARVIADERAEPDVAISVALNDWMAVSEFNVGDWIYLWMPDHGIEDLDNPITLEDGRVVFPVRKRVLGRVWTLGEGPFSCKVYEHATADPVDITDQVKWSGKTGATLEVGDLLPDFTTDPQGGGAYRQYLRFRASQPTDA